MEPPPPPALRPPPAPRPQRRRAIAGPRPPPPPPQPPPALGRRRRRHSRIPCAAPPPAAPGQRRKSRRAPAKRPRRETAPRVLGPRGSRAGRPAGRRRVGLLGARPTQMGDARRRASLLSFWGLVPTRAEPLRKKKKVDPKKDQAAKERLKKRIRRLEKATQELIPIEDFITPVKLLNQARQRPPVELPFEESERRALLLKKWSLYKQREHELERAAIASLLEAQREALQELELTAPELHAEATKRDPSLFPFERQGPDYTPPIANYQPPEGRYQDITKVYTQVEFKR
ncbi:large ribosomal subunit protein mL40 isoform X2 [Bos javanicus]|uniref:large ribosomal subunit protein mL40 isoform X2 n=1 Tax=Bos javanicus TaxID=9906 RepID=UPI002AA60641|nr:large ribosomal subunit protein mL40 isoform X2 [Bos javanicus]